MWTSSRMIYDAAPHTLKLHIWIYNRKSNIHCWETLHQNLSKYNGRQDTYHFTHDTKLLPGIVEWKKVQNWRHQVFIKKETILNNISVTSSLQLNFDHNPWILNSSTNHDIIHTQKCNSQILNSAEYIISR